MSFRDLGLSEQTIHAIEDLGYQEPTTVQKDVIPSVLLWKMTSSPSLRRLRQNLLLYLSAY